MVLWTTFFSSSISSKLSRWEIFAWIRIRIEIFIWIRVQLIRIQNTDLLVIQVLQNIYRTSEAGAVQKSGATQNRICVLMLNKYLYRRQEDWDPYRYRSKEEATAAHRCVIFFPKIVITFQTLYIGLFCLFFQGKKNSALFVQCTTDKLTPRRKYESQLPSPGSNFRLQYGVKTGVFSRF